MKVQSKGHPNYISVATRELFQHRSPSVLNRFLFRLAKRRCFPWSKQASSDDTWRKDQWGRWNIALVPTTAYLVEIVLLTLALPAAVFLWVYGNTRVWEHPDYCLDFWPTAVTMLPAALIPVGVWLFTTWLTNRDEVLSSIWNELPRSKRQHVTGLLRIPTRRLPYSWMNHSGEEQLLRFAMKDFFSLQGSTPKKPAINTLARLVAWFTAPAYLSLISLYALAIAISLFFPKAAEAFFPSAWGVFSLLSAAWAVIFFLYSRTQLRRIASQLDAYTTRFAYLMPGFSQSTSKPAPNIRTAIVAAVIPGTLTFLTTLNVMIFESLLTTTN